MKSPPVLRRFVNRADLLMNKTVIMRIERSFKLRILHECSCFIEFIKRNGENELNKLNYTGAQMLDSIYQMTPKLLLNRVFV